MSRRLLPIDDARARIEAGEALLLAGDRRLLAQLPAGRWIGGSIPYFMDTDGGEVSRDLVYVDALPEQVTDVKVCTYGVADLDQLAADRFDNGFSVIILPATSEVHLAYAADAPTYAGLFLQPMVGWVAGLHLDDLGTDHAEVFDGSGGDGSAEVAVVLHAELPDGVLASVDIVNLFTQGDGPTLTFDDTGFAQETVLVDGQPRDFAEYLTEIGHDMRLPLVADYFGAMVNASIQNVPDAGGAVELYAPVFKGVDYRLAGSLGDYVDEFEAALPTGTAPAFACNCILNFVYSELEGKQTGTITGPITFGEIAYQLLNQTMVYLTIHD